MKNNSSLALNYDKTAIYLSVICLIQCLALPLSALFLPTLIFLPLIEQWFHILLLFFVVPISVLAMFLGCRKHKSYNVIFYGFIGLTILIVNVIWGHEFLGESGEIISTLIGISILSYGHIQNQRLCKLSCHS
tara:strand:+ start:1993 stop:2391 length:399 start_codon:yes stop_codon:yes gene_type:complete